MKRPSTLLLAALLTAGALVSCQRLFPPHVTPPEVKPSASAGVETMPAPTAKTKGD